ncbi:MAG TPA: potassium channel family protein [Sphingomonas sp.]|jgi:voltage-gated potassium channel
MHPAAPDPEDSVTLHRKSRISAAVTLACRTALALALIGVALAAHWFDRDGLRDNIDGHISFIDVLYFTMITVTTVGYGDIVPVTDRARLFDTFLLTPIRLFVWLIFLGTAYDFLFRQVWRRWRMSKIQRTLSGHVVVAGYGVSGTEAVDELVRRGTPVERIVVVEEREEQLQAAEARGCTVADGDATRNATLEAVHIARARAIIVSAGRDDTSILIVLTARGLAPDVPISVVIRSADNEPLAKQAGATTVINPASFAGLLLAGSVHGPHMAAYLADLAAAHGEVELVERSVAASEIGQPLSAITTGLGVRILRDHHRHAFWEPAAARLEPGDAIVEIIRAGKAGRPRSPS